MARAIPQKTQTDRLAERAAELDYYAQLQAAQDQRRAEQHAQEQAFLQRVAAYHGAVQGALARGEELPPASIPSLDSAIRQSTAAVLAAERVERREQAADPVHQRLEESLLDNVSHMLPPAQRQARAEATIDANREQTLDESFNTLQNARHAVKEEEKMVQRVAGATPAEIAYQQQRLASAQQQEQAALAVFNEIAGVVIPAGS